MAKSILITLPPKTVADILNGRQTIIIRKTAPKCEFPIDVYIYCTKELKEGILVKNSSTMSIGFVKGNAPKKDNLERLSHIRTLNGKIVARFTMDEIEKIDIPYPAYFHEVAERYRHIVNGSCLSLYNLHRYLMDSTGYAWHIFDLKIFDEPKELGAFRKYKLGRWTFDFYAEVFGESENEFINLQNRRWLAKAKKLFKINRASSSWQYVEAKE